jgi:hypothetical protein
MKTKPLKNLVDLTPNGKELVASPPLQGEPLHRRLARLNRELAEATEALQSFNKEWAAKNIKAQACRLAISTPEITFAANKRRELAARIREIQTQIGIANKERRSLNAKTSQKASGGGLEGELLPFPKKQVRSKNCPLKQHREGTGYFELAARDELAPDLYPRVERTAKALLEHAISTGIEES